MKYIIIDDFLPQKDFQSIKNIIIGNQDFDWHIHDEVTNSDYREENEQIDYKNQNWNWYMYHLFYFHVPYSSYFDSILQIFSEKFYKMGDIIDFKSLIRVKANFYPYTSEVKEHQRHKDYPFSHKGAVFSLNTCDGFTRMVNGDKIDSVENRLVVFDPSEYHNSSTTSSSRARFNINFNWI